MRKKAYYRVYSVIDRGEGASPRFVGGYCHPFGMEKARAVARARDERRAGRIDVRLDRCDSYGNLLPGKTTRS